MTAIREYGLTEETGRGRNRLIRVSDMGSALIRPNPPRELLKKAALNPPPFQELWAQIKTGKAAPASTVQRILRADREKRGELPFTEQGANEAFRIFRMNVEYVGLADEDDPFAPDRPEEEKAFSSNSSEHSRSARGDVAAPGLEAAYQEIRVPLNSGRDAKFLYPGNPTRAELEQLKVMLEGVRVIVEGLLKQRDS
ncbi:MAG: hypothetical protein NW217_01300 [Hyphomicrobiaceae bacterium]|nr:hypothetical protein [Hyphomicrobiaceae bacterium]